MLLEETYQKTLNIENEFEKKKILFIPTESYDDPAITIIEGLHKLGFEILTYKKSNINSWFCNKIITNLDNIEDEIDFVISNIHWGTRWSLYKKLKHKVPYVLINGEDRLHKWSKHKKWKRSNWKDTIECREKKYKLNPPENIKDIELSLYRWVENVGDYKPDIIFALQKYKINTDSIFLPSGIKDSYYKYCENKDIKDRKIDICHIGGKYGEYRKIMTQHLNKYPNKNNYNIFNNIIYGETNSDKKIKNFIDKDKNIHSWHRWRVCSDYSKILSNSKILIIHGIDKYYAPGWDNKRLKEAIAAGCYVLYQTGADFDDSTYPKDELCDFSRYKFNNFKDLENKIEYLLSNPKILEEKRNEFLNKGNKYFNTVTITRYFLWNIKNKFK
jgi:hypothetical protein